MSTNQKPVLFKHPIVRHSKMLAFGTKHGIAPKGATVAKFIIERVLKIDSMPEVQSVLSIEGGNTLSFIEQAVYEALKRRGYFRDKRGSSQ